MGLVFLRQEPLDGFVVAPFNELSDFITHEVEFCAWVRHLVERECAHAGKLAPPITRHTADERTFAIDNLVVRKRQHEVLVKGVHHRERKQSVIARPPGKIGLHVVQGIVHPSHIPLVVETQTAFAWRVGNEGPSGGFLGYHHHVGHALGNASVDGADEGAGIQVLFGSQGVEFFVGFVVDSEVEIQHARDAIHADAIDVEVLKPEQHVGGEETHYLGA